MRNLVLFILLLPGVANATSYHYDIQPGSYFYVHVWGGPGVQPAEFFPVDCTGGFLDADTVLGSAHLFGTYDGGVFDVSVSDAYEGSVFGGDELQRIGPNLHGTVDFRGSSIVLDELGSFIGPSSFRTLAPGVIQGGNEWNGMMGDNLIEWAFGFTGVRSESQPAAVPEPMTAALVGIGAVMMRKLKEKRIAQ